MQTLPTETLGARIRRIRKATLIKHNGKQNPMTQELLAALAGCDKGTISRIERNVQQPGIKILQAIALALKVTLEILLGFTIA